MDYNPPPRPPPPAYDASGQGIKEERSQQATVGEDVTGEKDRGDLGDLTDEVEEQPTMVAAHSRREVPQGRLQ